MGLYGVAVGPEIHEGGEMRRKSNCWERQTAKSRERMVNDATGAEECIVS